MRSFKSLGYPVFSIVKRLQVEISFVGHVIVVESHRHSQISSWPPVITVLPSVVEMRGKEADFFFNHIIYISDQLVVSILVRNVFQVEVDLQLRLGVFFPLTIFFLTFITVFKLNSFLNAFKLGSKISLVITAALFTQALLHRKLEYLLLLAQP